jgi:putative ABC transport system substrate-binding protein
MIERRVFVSRLLSGLLAAPLVAEAQQVGSPPRVGVIRRVSGGPLEGLLRQAFRDFGYVENKNIRIEWRFHEGREDRLPAVARDLVRLKVAAIVTFGTVPTTVARRATTAISIVAGSDDLVAEGHVASLSRPGGNVTGVSILASELNVKRLELLKQAVPGASRIVVLWDPDTGSHHLDPLESAARSMAVELKILEVRGGDDLDRTFQVAREWRAQAMNVLASARLNGLRSSIFKRAATGGLPAIYQWDTSAKEGGLMAYGPTTRDFYRLVLLQLDKVLRGAKPADVPVVQPSEFKLVVNLKTARVLGLTIPPSLLLRADQVVE